MRIFTSYRTDARPSQDACARHTDWVAELTVLSDGRLASGSGDNPIQLWDPKSGEEIKRMGGFSAFLQHRWQASAEPPNCMCVLAQQQPRKAACRDEALPKYTATAESSLPQRLPVRWPCPVIASRGQRIP